MKPLLVILIGLLFVSPLLGQSNKTDQAEQLFSKNDSTLNYLRFIEQNNQKISKSHNNLLLGFKAKSSDSLLIMINSYQMQVDEIITNTTLIEVDNSLSTLKNNYIEWFKSISYFFTSNSYKLIEFDATNRNSNQGVIEIDNKYKDKQLSVFFEELDKAQEQWRNLFFLEQSRVQEINRREIEITK